MEKVVKAFNELSLEELVEIYQIKGSGVCCGAEVSVSRDRRP